MRDKLIHDYFGVNVDITQENPVWKVVRDDLSQLIDQKRIDTIALHGQLVVIQISIVIISKDEE